MKISLFLSAFWLFWATLFSPVENTVLVGSVRDQSGQPLFGARVTIQQERKVVQTTATDLNGKYRMEVEPGLYQVEFAFTGYVAQRIVEVKVEAGKENILDVTLEAGAALSEIVVTGQAARKENRSKGMGAAPTGKAEPSRPVTYDGAKRTTTARSVEKAPAPIVKDELRPLAKPKPVLLDGPTEAPDATVDKAAMRKDIPTSDEVGSPAPRAGLLTAGEWNDLHNWNRHWQDLLADGETDAFQSMYSFFPRQRYTLMLTNENDVPLVDAVTQLKTSSGKIIWEARTDNTGKAELWEALFSKEPAQEKPRVEVWLNGKKQVVDDLKPADKGFNYLKVKAECNAPKNVDIVWAVDATGSMGDEIEYLKTELLDVIGRAKSLNPELAFRMGTVFYRDKGDEYITKSSGLSPDISLTVQFIQKQFAGGGGDYPEAVHSALEETVFAQKWSENAVARICFLVLDASPHREPEVIASLQKSIREAAKLGIRIVPIAASGIQKDTEFLMKFFGLATNGTYVFLTDHSGIGGKHLEPTTDEYKVEPLNNLLVRLITEYTSIKTCEGKSEIRFENDPQQQPGPMMQALYYPNPAVDQFTLELPFEVQSVTIYDSEGKAVRKLEKPIAGPNRIQIQDLAAGFYTIRILNNGVMQSGKLMVVRS